MDDPDAEPNLLMTARAGSGKSMLLVQWLARPRAADIDVAFVPISLRYGTNRDVVFLEALAVRLAKMLGATLSAPVSNPAEHYRAHAAEYLQRLPLPGRRCLIVIDGLDEATGSPVDTSWLPSHPPAGLRILLSARETALLDGEGWHARVGWLLDRAPARRLAVPPLDAQGARDLLGANRIALDPDSEHLVAAELMRLTQGDPLLLQLYADDLRALGGRGVGVDASSLSAIQPGYAAYFQDWMRRQEEAWHQAGLQPDDRWKAVLALLAVAKGPLPHGDLEPLMTQMLGGATVTDLSVIALIDRFLLNDGMTSGYVLAHPKLADFLRTAFLSRGGWIARAEAAYLAWGRKVVRSLTAGSLPPATTPRYLLQFLSSHLQDANAPPADFLELSGKGWLRAWEAFEGTYRGFSQDIARAAAAVDEAGAEGLRCRLLLCSVASIGSLIPAELLARAVRSGVMPSREAIHWLDYKSGLALVEATAVLAERLPGPEREAVIDKALAALPQIGSDEDLAAAVSLLAAPLGPAATRLVPAASQIIGEDHRAAALRSLIPLLPHAMLEEQYHDICRFDDAPRRAELLGLLARRFADRRRAALVEEALETADAIPVPRVRAARQTALLDLVPAGDRAGFARDLLARWTREPSPDAAEIGLMASLLGHVGGEDAAFYARYLLSVTAASRYDASGTEALRKMALRSSPGDFIADEALAVAGMFPGGAPSPRGIADLAGHVAPAFRRLLADRLIADIGTMDDLARYERGREVAGAVAALLASEPDTARRRDAMRSALEALNAPASAPAAAMLGEVIGRGIPVGLHAEVLRVADRIGIGRGRFAVLARAAAQLSPWRRKVLATRLLRDAAAIDLPRGRAEALAALFAELPELISQAIPLLAELTGADLAPMATSAVASRLPDAERIRWFVAIVADDPDRARDPDLIAVLPGRRRAAHIYRARALGDDAAMILRRVALDLDRESRGGLIDWARALSGPDERTGCLLALAAEADGDVRDDLLGEMLDIVEGTRRDALQPGTLVDVWMTLAREPGKFRLGLERAIATVTAVTHPGLRRRLWQRLVDAVPEDDRIGLAATLIDASPAEHADELLGELRAYLPVPPSRAVLRAISAAIDVPAFAANLTAIASHLDDGDRVRALAIASAMDAAPERTMLVRSVIDTMTPLQRAALVRAVEASPQKFLDDEARAAIRSALAPPRAASPRALAEQDGIRTALARAKGIHDETSRIAAAGALLPFLPEETRADARRWWTERARALDNPLKTRRSLLLLATHADRDEAVPRIIEAFALVRVGSEATRQQDLVLAAASEHDLTAEQAAQRIAVAIPALIGRGGDFALLAALAAVPATPLLTERLDLLRRQLLDTLPSQEEPWERVRAIAAIACGEPAHLAFELRAAAWAMNTDDGARLAALAAIAPLMPQSDDSDLVSRGLRAAHALRGLPRRRLIAALAQRISGTRSAAAQELLELALTEDEPVDRVRSLIAVAPCDQLAIGHAFGTMAAMEHSSARAQAIALLMPHLHRQQWAGALADFIGSSAALYRKELLALLPAFYPAVDRLHGKDAVRLLHDSLMDIDQWFP